LRRGVIKLQTAGDPARFKACHTAADFAGIQSHS
jgi:hypothetical protein